MKKIRSALFAVAMLVVTAPLLAITYIVPNDRDLVTRAEAIIIATGIESHPELTAGPSVVTVAEMQVEQVLKGSLRPGTSVRLVEIGGSFGHLTRVIPGSPRYESGRRYLIFLRRTPQGEWATWGMGLGRFEFVRDLRGHDFLIRGGDGDDVFGFSEADWTPHVERYRKEVEFLHFIQAVTSTSSAIAPTQQDYFADRADVVLASFASDSVRLRPEVTAPRKDFLFTGDYRRSNATAAFVHCCQPTLQPGLDGPSAIVSGTANWTNAGTSVVYTAGAHDSGATGGLVTADGKNAVLFNDPAGQLPAGVAAAGGVSNDLGPYQFTDGFFYRDTSEGDVVINDGLSTSQGTFVGIMTHELGHTLGFRHSNESKDLFSMNPCTAPLPCTTDAVMATVVAFGLSSLRPYDLEAVQTVYGSGPVCTPPSIQNITANPFSITSGQSSTLSVQVTGSAPQTFEWFIGTPPNTSQPIPGATGSSIQVSPTATTSYFVKVSGCGQAVASQAVQVQVTGACPNVSLSAASAISNGGFTLTATPTGGSGFSFQWFIGQIGGPSAGPTTQQIFVNPSETTTYFVRATNSCGRFADASVTVTIQPQGLPAIEFSASPTEIQQGQTSTLTWTTTNATSVTIDNGIGTRPASGSVTVNPSVTTLYTLTATGSGGTSTARTTVFVQPGLEPIVSITSFPTGLVQSAGDSGATDQFVLTNLGRTPTTITLTQTGSFFTQSPTSFTLAPDGTQTVTIRATAQQPGMSEGTSIPSGAGVPVGLTIPVRLLVAAPPLGTVVPAPSNPRPELSAPAEVNPSGSVDFTNSGTATLQGIVTTDAAWLIPPRDVITIAPGETKTVTFMTDRTLRPDASALVGAATAQLSLIYLDSAPSSGLRASGSGSSSKATISVSIVDVVKPNVGAGSPPPLGAGELALFAAGLPQRSGTAGDLLLSSIGGSISDLKLFFGGPGASSLTGALSQIGPNSGLALPAVLKTVFATSAPSGTVQVRTAEISRVAVASVQTNTSSRVGSYITALPTFRSDRFVGPGQSLHLPGVEKAGGRLTNVFVQEVGGTAGSVEIDFLGAAGNVVGTRDADAITAFGLISLLDVVPPGTASVRVRNVSPDSARIAAYALVTDSVTQDGWVVTDAGPSSTIFVPLLPAPNSSVKSANTISIINTQSTPVSVTLDVVTPVGRRRSVRTTSTGSNARPIETQATRTMTIEPLQTVLFDPATTASGFVRVTGTGPFAVSARSMITGSGRLGSFGSTLPALSADAALADNQSKRFSSVDDASQRTVNRATPVTYRSNLALLETAGQPATVRLTLRYTFSAGTRTTATGMSTLDVPMEANKLAVVQDLGKAIIGAQREGYGDLRNMQLDVQVLGSGRVIPILQTIDNGSADVTVRTE